MEVIKVNSKVTFHIIVKLIGTIKNHYAIRQVIYARRLYNSKNQTNINFWPVTLTPPYEYIAIYDVCYWNWAGSHPMD